MKKVELETRTEVLIQNTHDALQEVFDALNHGQQQKLLKNEKIKALLDRYNVTY